MTIHDHEIGLWATRKREALDQEALVLIEISMSELVPILLICVASGLNEAAAGEMLKGYMFAQAPQERGLADT